jgi:hypothetical protein
MDFKVGDKIELLKMDNDPHPIPIGTKGRITKIGPMPYNETQIHVDWDNGRTLMLVYPEDKFRVISPGS